jgi:Icc-related predicted phosphoesterase
VAISDTHGLQGSVRVPDGDILIHAGDITMGGDLEDVTEFNRFLGKLPHRHKIVIAGNHDFCFEREPSISAGVLTNCIYLQDEAVTVEGIRFYGSPWQPWFYDWAFNLQRGPEIRAKWDLIPAGIDVLLTHGPPAGFGDRTVRNRRVGCADLLDALRRVRPRLHVFGHIHEDPGEFRDGAALLVNASVCDVRYRPVQPARVIQWPIPEAGG